MNSLPNEENADTGVVLCAYQSEVFLEIVESCLGDSVAVEIVLSIISIPALFKI